MHDHDRTFRASRRSTSVKSSASISTILERPRCPATTRTDPADTSSAAASSSTSAWFARPRSGGAATLAFQPSPCRPTSPVRAAPGETVTLIRAGEILDELLEDRDIGVRRLVRVCDRERPLLLAAGRHEDPAVQAVQPGQVRELLVGVAFEEIGRAHV